MYKCIIFYSLCPRQYCDDCQCQNNQRQNYSTVTACHHKISQFSKSFGTSFYANGSLNFPSFACKFTSNLSFQLFIIDLIISRWVIETFWYWSHVISVSSRIKKIFFARSNPSYEHLCAKQRHQNDITWHKNTYPQTCLHTEKPLTTSATKGICM